VAISAYALDYLEIPAERIYEPMRRNRLVLQFCYLQVFTIIVLTIAEVAGSAIYERTHLGQITSIPNISPQ
jgi:hypothetical protein